jgi:hypothetical protein
MTLRCARSRVSSRCLDRKLRWFAQTGRRSASVDIEHEYRSAVGVHGAPSTVLATVTERSYGVCLCTTTHMTSNTSSKFESFRAWMRAASSPAALPSMRAQVRIVLTWSVAVSQSVAVSFVVTSVHPRMGAHGVRKSIRHGGARQ